MVSKVAESRAHDVENYLAHAAAKTYVPVFFEDTFRGYGKHDTLVGGFVHQGAQLGLNLEIDSAALDLAEIIVQDDSAE